MSRATKDGKKITGNFGSVEELEQKVRSLKHYGLAVRVISERCGVSTATVRKILRGE